MPSVTLNAKTQGQFRAVSAFLGSGSMPEQLPCTGTVLLSTEEALHIQHVHCMS